MVSDTLTTQYRPYVACRAIMIHKVAARQAKGEGREMSLQLEMVSCGDCPKCLAGGKVHGPYWYRYFRRGGKMISEYVGKEIGSKDSNEKYPKGATPEDLFPERVERMRAEAEQDADVRLQALAPAQQELIDSIVGMKADARRAYRRARKADADPSEITAATDEQQRLRERIQEEKNTLREMLARRSQTQEAAGEAMA